MNVTFTDNMLSLIIGRIFYSTFSTENLSTNFRLTETDTTEETVRFVVEDFEGDKKNVAIFSEGLVYAGSDYISIYPITEPNYKKEMVADVNSIYLGNLKYNIFVNNGNITVTLSGECQDPVDDTVYAIGYIPDDRYIYAYYDIPPTKINAGDRLTFTFVMSIGGTCNVR